MGDETKWFCERLSHEQVLAGYSDLVIFFG